MSASLSDRCPDELGKLGEGYAQLAAAKQGMVEAELARSTSGDAKNLTGLGEELNRRVMRFRT